MVSIDHSFDGEAVMRSFASQTTGSVYVAFLIRVSDATPNSGNGHVVKLGSTGMDVWNPGLDIEILDDGAGKFLFGVTKTGGSHDFTTASYDYNTTYLVVGSYEFVAGAINDNLNLWVNPAVGPTAPTPDLTVSPGSDDAADIANIGINRFDAPPTSFQIDAIKVSTTWPATGTASNTIFIDDFESGDYNNWSDVSP